MPDERGKLSDTEISTLPKPLLAAIAHGRGYNVRGVAEPGVGLRESFRRAQAADTNFAEVTKPKTAPKVATAASGKA